MKKMIWMTILLLGILGGCASNPQGSKASAGKAERNRDFDLRIR